MYFNNFSRFVWGTKTSSRHSSSYFLTDSASQSSPLKIPTVRWITRNTAIVKKSSHLRPCRLVQPLVKICGTNVGPARGILPFLLFWSTIALCIWRRRAVTSGRERCLLTCWSLVLIASFALSCALFACSKVSFVRTSILVFNQPLLEWWSPITYYYSRRSTRVL